MSSTVNTIDPKLIDELIKNSKSKDDFFGVYGPNLFVKDNFHLAEGVECVRIYGLIIEQLSLGPYGIRALSPNREYGLLWPSPKQGFERAGLTYFAIKFYPRKLVKNSFSTHRSKSAAPVALA